MGIDDMAKVLDDVLKVYVLNMEILGRTTTVEEFARLYEEFKEFEIIDEQFFVLNKPAIKRMLDYASAHLPEFVTVT